MKNVTILGSCVTRDAFEQTTGKYNIEHYFARTSFVSLTSPPLELKEEDILLDSKFQRRCVYNDLTNQFFNSKRSDFIIIDLIDERFNLLKIGDSYITRSNEFANAKLTSDYESTLIKRDLDFRSEWTEAAESFIIQLLDKYRPEEIILHKTLWQDYYYDSKGNKQRYEQKINEIKHHNRLLESYYGFLEARFPEIKVIDMTTEPFLASENHKWGLSPFHFEENYYRRFLEILSESIDR
ncbi:DUF6270 domain-containing protein (plasmid) [Rossellomorea sp. AcN35-11]|nr:DUF6270 domain-containing protein [Rossellomorea aquimaris]WJV32362.1 DUF6270 domain-containing protein [Rossellomorea sp. AcN35-11]